MDIEKLASMPLANAAEGMEHKKELPITDWLLAQIALYLKQIAEHTKSDSLI